MLLLLKNAHCVDPAVQIDGVLDILISDGVLAKIGQPGTLDLPNGEKSDAGCRTIDLTGQVLLPGLMDMHVHLRDPGQEYKEDIASGGAAASHGGFSEVLCMPNTQPTIDNASQVTYVRERAAAVTRTRVQVAGALTAGLKGQALAEMGDMAAAGALAFTDDGRGVQDSGLERLAMEYAATLGRPVLSHCQDEALVGQGQINEGLASTRLGLAPWPALGEEAQIARDIALAELTGAHLHIQHITTAAGVELVAAAKAKGLPVSCEVTPHHLFLSEADLDETYNTALKMNPPLRHPRDAAALRVAFVEGQIDCLSTDHAPHAAHEKALEFELAPFGTTGLETALGLVLTELIYTKAFGYAQLVERMAHAPRRILGLPPLCLEVGAPADLTVLDPAQKWTVEAADFVSKSANSAFLGRSLIGRASYVFVGGEASLMEGRVVAR